MKRNTFVIVLLACGFLATSPPLLAQVTPTPTPTPAPAPDAPATTTTNWFEGQASILLLGRDDVDSSKFEEYRTVPKGFSMPVFTLQGSEGGNDYALFGQNISRDDQRYQGWANLGWLGLSFDYNQIPHNMGNDGRTIHTETAEGVWSMSATLRKSLGDAVDAVPTAARTYPFYVDLLTPTINAANYVDISSLRKRGEYGFDFGSKLPFNLAFTYLHEIKSGSRGASAGDILGTVTSLVDVPEPLNEVTQDLGIRWAWNFKTGDVHATFNRNLFDSRVDALIIDNPFRATDLAYSRPSVPGGPAQARFSTAPDNEATRGAFGFQLKLGAPDAGGRRRGVRHLDAEPGLPPVHDQLGDLHADRGPGQRPGVAPAAVAERQDRHDVVQLLVHLAPDRRGSGSGCGIATTSTRTRRTAGSSPATRQDLRIAAGARPTPPTAEEPYGHATANRTDSSTGGSTLRSATTSRTSRSRARTATCRASGSAARVPPAPTAARTAMAWPPCTAPASGWISASRSTRPSARSTASAPRRSRPCRA